MILANIILLFCCILASFMVQDNGLSVLLRPYRVRVSSNKHGIHENVQKFSALAISEYEQFSNQSKFNSALTTEIFSNVLLLRLKVMI